MLCTDLVHRMRITGIYPHCVRPGSRQAGADDDPLCGDVTRTAEFDLARKRLSGKPATSRIDGVWPLAINRDATLVAMHQYPNGVVLWDRAAGRMVRTPKGQSRSPVHIRFRPCPAPGRLRGRGGQRGCWSDRHAAG